MCVFVSVLEIKTVGERGWRSGGAFEIMCQECLRAVCVCVYLSENETELVSARLGVCTPGAKCIRLS